MVYGLTEESGRVARFMEGWDREDEEEETGPDPARRRSAAAHLFGRPTSGPDPDPARTRALDAVSARQAEEDRRRRGAPGLDAAITDWKAADGFGGALGRMHAAPQRLRALFSLVQTSFSIGALTRLTVRRDPQVSTPFDDYRTWLRSLINAGAGLERARHGYEALLRGEADAALARAPKRSRIARPAGSALQTTANSALRHPFYRDEIAWLYNERGLASLTQGMLYDAIPLFEQAAFVMSHNRTPSVDSHAHHAAERRIILNLGIAEIERGNIEKARRILRELESSSNTVDGSTPSGIHEYAQLYLNLCDQLTGAVQRAEKGYARLIDTFNDRGRLRAISIANRFQADLLRRRGRLEDARTQADIAMAAASRANQRDIEALAQVTLARIEIETDEERAAQVRLQQVIGYARRMGLVAIETDAKLALAHHLNNGGDSALAGQVAAEAVAMAVQNGLRLRKLSGLVAFAETRFSIGSHGFARRILREAIREAEQLRYLTLAERAHALAAGMEGAYAQG